MSHPESTVGDLVARFQLRRRASTEAFREGVRLARSKLVSLGEVRPDVVTAQVRDDRPVQVELRVEDGSLIGRCSCDAATFAVCRHQVAVAHVLWVSRRRSRGFAHAVPPGDSP
jgi:uncharacterized Zn finger protein